MPGGLLQTLAVGFPLIVAGAVKAGYDIAQWRWAKREASVAPPAHLA
jgi:hypothetical protein